jgi:hypothetical protein
VLRCPASAPVPAFAVNALYGDLAMIVTTGQRVVSARPMKLGYEFRHPDLEARCATRHGRIHAIEPLDKKATASRAIPIDYSWNLDR